MLGARTAVGLLVAIALLAVSATAQAPALPPPTGYVNDFAKVLDEASVVRMETMARNFAERTQADVAIVVLPSLDGRPIEEVGLRLGREWKIGRGQEKDGVLVLLAIEDRRSRIEVSRHLEDEIPDLVAMSILSGARSHFAAGNYGRGLTQVVETLLATIADRKGISIEGIDQRRALPVMGTRGSSDEGSIWPFVIVVAVILLIMLFSRSGGGRGGRRNRGGWSGPFIIWGGGGGSWGGSGGGGWSGGGGDSWGGFGGGGDFGGGGASDSW